MSKIKLSIQRHNKRTFNNNIKNKKTNTVTKESLCNCKPNVHLKTNVSQRT